jgi:DUF4097 and DUF4098 domain-containing protein YvlB
MSKSRVPAIATAVFLSLMLVLPVLAGSRIERELALEPGGRLVLDADLGDVEVTGGSASGVHVVMTADKLDLEEDLEITFDASGGEVEIDVDKKSRGGISGLFDWGSKGNLKIEIRVPTETELAIDTSGGPISVREVVGTADLNTSGGPIFVEDLEGALSADTSGGPIRASRIRGDVDADTSGGPINIDEVEGSVNADTSGGPIRISEVTGNIVADTSGGGIEIRGAGGRVEADTSGGSVEVSFAAGNQMGGSISASGGGITVRLDPAANLLIDAATSGGNVVSDLPITVTGKVEESSLRGTLGSGGEALRLRSSGGSIRIKKL